MGAYKSKRLTSFVGTSLQCFIKLCRLKSLLPFELFAELLLLLALYFAGIDVGGAMKRRGSVIKVVLLKRGARSYTAVNVPRLSDDLAIAISLR